MGAKAAHKMLMKLTTGHVFQQLQFHQPSPLVQSKNGQVIVVWLYQFSPTKMQPTLPEHSIS